MLKGPILIPALILLVLIAATAESEQITFGISAGLYHIEETEEGFHRIDMSDFTLLGEPGKPRLPMRQYHFALPPGAQVTAVRVMGDHQEVLEGSYRIEPAPGAISLDREWQAVGRSKESWQAGYDAVYRSDEPFPESVGESLGIGGLRKYTVLRVAYYPFAYRPISGQLSFCPRATVEVDYRLPDPGSEAERQVWESLFDPLADERAGELLDNGSQAQVWYRADETDRSSKESYDYIIITTTNLEGAVADLAAWKEELGHSVNVVTTSWISSSYPGSDLEEEIRNFLVDTYTSWGIQYVLLAGNIDVIPMRLCYPSGHSNPVPSDYYYADLTGDWDFDGDGYYGEPGQDAVDFLAEVSVGRIPYSGYNTLADICDKLVATESDTGSWKDNALLLGAFINFANEDRSGYPATDGAWMAQRMMSDIFVGWDITTMYEKSGLAPSGLACDFPLNNANVVGQWSAKDYGIVAWAAHGSSDAAWRKYWSTDDGDGVPESNEMSWPYFLATSDVASLDDGHPAIVFCASCENGHPEHAHLAGELIKNGSAGAIAATRVSYGIIGWTQKDDGGIESLCYYFYDDLVNRDQPVGAALYNSKYFCWTHNWQNYQNMYDFCLYGEPALRRRGMAPTPQVLAAEPRANTYLSPVDGELTVRFDRPMDPATLNDTTVVVTGQLRGRYAGTVTYDPATLTVTLDPFTAFLPGEPIRVQVTGAVSSAAGTAVSGGHGWSFHPLSPGGSSSFEEDTVLASSLDPSSICPGDFDGDGHVDLAVAHLSLDQVSIWLNDGLGIFSLNGTCGVGARPRGLAAGDLDGNGSLDLVTADSSAHQVSVLLNNGDGSFAAHQAYGTSQRPRDACLADLNGDGHLDVAAAGSRFDEVSVLLNNGDGTLAAAVSYDVGDSPWAICAGDLDGDGRADLITANHGSDDVSVLINEGGGTFGSAASHPAGDGPHGLCLADLSGDGLVDLAVADKEADSICVLINAGAGVFTSAGSYVVGDEPLALRVADLDGDEDGDLLVACAGSGQVGILQNRGDGTFDPAVVAAAGSLPVSLCAADLDGDGDPDLSAANAGSDDVSVLFNIDALKVVKTMPGRYQRAVATSQDVVAGFNHPVDEGTLSDSVFIVCGSQTGCHRGSVMLGTDDSTVVLSPTAPFAPGEVITSMLTTGLKSHIGISMNNGYGWSFFTAAAGQGLFSAETSCAAGNTPQGVVAADLDNDGLVDLATANYQASSVGVFFNRGDGAIQLDSLYHVNDGPVRVCALDIEGDGDMDLASVNAWDYTVSVLRNEGGVFSLEANYPLGHSPYDMCAADLDGDGDPDLAVTNAGDDDISVLFNEGDGSFGPQIRYQVGNVPWGVEAGDVDGDGDFDLLAANWAENTFSVLANKGNGVFSAAQTYAVSGKARDMALGELNGDGHLDVALASYDDDLVMVALGRGDGSFVGDTAYQVDGDPSGIFLADLDGDGHQDLAVTRAARDSVTVMKNDGYGAFGQRQAYHVGDKPMGLCVLDADGDQALDVAVTCYDGDLLVLWYNTEGSWPPAAISDLTAALAGSCVHLAWSAVTLDQMGNPMLVDHYTVYRDTDPDFVPGPEDSIGGTADPFYQDTSSAVNNTGTSHYYLVKAVDAEGRTSIASATVGEFDVLLPAGAKGKTAE